MRKYKWFVSIGTTFAVMYAMMMYLIVLKRSGEGGGGPGIIVEIDEDAFGKRKYDCGHLNAVKWVFGDIETEEARQKKLT